MSIIVPEIDPKGFGVLEKRTPGEKRRFASSLHVVSVRLYILVPFDYHSTMVPLRNATDYLKLIRKRNGYKKKVKSLLTGLVRLTSFLGLLNWIMLSFRLFRGPAKQQKPSHLTYNAWHRTRKAQLKLTFHQSFVLLVVVKQMVPQGLLQKPQER